MAYVGDSENIMRPRKGDSTINLPITFDYSGGRKEANKSKFLWVGILTVLGFIIGMGIITSDEGFFLVNIIFGVAFMFGVALIIRFPMLKEHKIRETMIKMQDEDYKKSYTDMWGIHSMDDLYPYYAHLRNGRTAIYVQFEKDVIIGKVPDAEYEHYEAIGDAYNLAGSLQINMCHIDYMDNIGSDDRLVECFKELSEIENPDVRDLLTDVFSNLQDMMNYNVSTFDVYVFTFKCSENTFWYNIQQVFNCLLQANYINFKILNESDLRDLSKSLFNLHDFSVVEASASCFENKKYAGIIPISVTSSDGMEIVLNKTTEEKKEEMRIKEKELALKKEEDKRRKKKKKKSKNTSDEEIDIFS